MGKKEIKAKCWKLFSEMIRLRDCIITCNSTTYGKCCTCGNVYPIGKLQGGHFVEGRRNAILFDMENVNAQCVSCNMFHQGRPADYALWMLNHYGKTVMERLAKQRYEGKQFHEDELEAFSEWIKTKIASMKATRKVPDDIKPAYLTANH